MSNSAAISRDIELSKRLLLLQGLFAGFEVRGPHQRDNRFRGESTENDGALGPLSTRVSQTKPLSRLVSPLVGSAVGLNASILGDASETWGAGHRLVPGWT